MRHTAQFGKCLSPQLSEKENTVWMCVYISTPMLWTSFHSGQMEILHVNTNENTPSENDSKQRGFATLTMYDWVQLLNWGRNVVTLQCSGTQQSLSSPPTNRLQAETKNLYSVKDTNIRKTIPSMGKTKKKKLSWNTWIMKKTIRSQDFFFPHANWIFFRMCINVLLCVCVHARACVCLDVHGSGNDW